MLVHDYAPNSLSFWNPHLINSNTTIRGVEISDPHAYIPPPANTNESSRDHVFGVGSQSDRIGGENDDEIQNQERYHMCPLPGHGADAEVASPDAGSGVVSIASALGLAPGGTNGFSSPVSSAN